MKRKIECIKAINKKEKNEFIKSVNKKKEFNVINSFTNRNIKCIKPVN